MKSTTEDAVAKLKAEIDQIILDCGMTKDDIAKIEPRFTNSEMEIIVHFRDGTNAIVVVHHNKH